MTSYARNDASRTWEQNIPARKWLYQTPEQILIKASNGASDFGNKFGQPLICGSLLTFEHTENGKEYGYDKVIMQAGGVGYAKKKDCLKGDPEPGQKVIVMGGDNYRIGMIGIPVIWGGCMELLQRYCTTTRTGDWLDELTNTLGAIAGFFFGRWILPKILKRKLK